LKPLRVDHCCERLFGENVGNKVMAIEAITAQRNEQRLRAARTRVDRDRCRAPREQGLVADIAGAAAKCAKDFAECEDEGHNFYAVINAENVAQTSCLQAGSLRYNAFSW